MSTEATAEALAPPVEAEVSSEDAALEEVWEKLNSPEVDEPAVEPVAVEEPAEEGASVEPQAPEEAKAPDPEAPSELPKAVREHWKDIPAEARDAFANSQQEMSRKLSDQGRQVHALGPMRDALVEMVQDIPQLKDMPPADVLRHMTEFRNNVIKPLETDPLRTIMQVAEQRGIMPQLRDALNGEQPSQASDAFKQLHEQNQILRRELTNINDRIASVERTPVQDQVTGFAEKVDHWADVEDVMPIYISTVKAEKPEASTADVLQEAYDLAVMRRGLQKPAPESTTTVDAVADAERTERALKASEVNVSGAPSAETPLTEDQILNKVWRKHNS